MNILDRPVFRRLLFALVAILTVAQANAVNRLFIDNFTISGPEPRTVAVMLDNSDEVAGLQFNIVMPEGLRMVGDPRRNQDRFAPGQNMSYSSSRGLFIVTSGSGNSFVGNSGVICWIDVQATPEALAAGADLKVKLDNVVLSTASGQRVPSDRSVETTVTVQEGAGILSATPEFVINPSDKKRVEVALDNNFDVIGIQFVISLPEGFSIMNNEIHVTDRVSNGVNVSLKPRADNKYGFVAVDFNGNPVVAQGKGNIFWFDVVAPADFSAEKAQIVFSGVEMTNRRNATIYGDGCSVNIVNGKTAYDSALARVADLQTKLNAALETIRTECPLVSELFLGTELQERINALDADIDAAYADYTLGTVYDQFMGVADAISNDIDAYIESARKAQAEEVNRLETNKKAYEADLAAIAGLQAALDAAKAEIAEKYPDFVDLEAEAAVQNTINELKSAVEAAYAAVAEEGYYNYKLDAAAVEAQIAALVTGAAARYDANRQALNKAAYDADLAKIAELQAAFEAAKAEVAEKYADFANDFEEAATQSSINALKNAVDAAYAAVVKEGFYDYKLDTSAVEAQIAALVTNAAARYEANRNAVNKAAYDADLAKVAGLQTALDAAKAEIAEKYAGYGDAVAEAAAQTAIDAVKAEVEKAYADVAVEGFYSYKLETAAIEAQIAALITDAKARWAEANREEANKQAYEADLAKIAALQISLDAAKSEVAEKYAEFADADAEAAAQNAINELKSAVEAAYAAVAEEGLYDYKLDTAAVEAQIAAIVTDAAARYEANRKAVNKAAYDADLAKIAELQAALDAAKAEIVKKYAEFADTAAEAAAQASVNALKGAVDAAYAAVAEAGFYDYKLNTADVEAEIAALVTDAAARYEANRQAVNKAAYEADLAKVVELQAALDAAKAEIAEKYADYADAEAEAAVQAAIDAAKADVEKAYADVAEEGFYSYELDAEAIEAQIAALVADAKARWTEANREAANKAAYEADLAKIAELQAALDAAKAEIAEKYEGFGNETEIESIQNKINSMKASVEAAYEAVATEGNYSYTLDVESLETRIAALVPEAAEAYRVDFNVKAYNADLDAIEGVKAKYEEALEEIRTHYPGQINNPLVADVLNQITAAQTACMLEFEDVRYEGFYESQVNVEALEQSIKSMLDQIKGAGVDGIYMDEDLEGVEIYTLDGIRRNTLVRGQVNVLRYKDGTVKKVNVN